MSAHARVPERVDAALDAVQASTPNPVRHRASADAEGLELRAAHHAVLRSGDHGEFCTTVMHKAPRSHRAGSGPPGLRRVVAIL